ncbi:Ubiquitin homeostasis protein-like protein [Emericellopsis cladophorae]|uniref:Ubiquitin homeostasis protein-like protein n=1 Tax=Emericellopsis cladophorae TaxID=2686198 RepID=A0A9P9XZ44_9HYPO|nr:Ubiquitin homeostasis protein-like protein [Emericellopsis cladophorae]KAI6780551.1 Ubiquitin homeostasis protein-like protein [Emericellopsis cladophorae]
MAEGDFKLSAQLVGHEADVRAVCFPTDGLVLSASRDCSVRAWRRNADNKNSFDGTLVSRGSEYVNSLTFFPANREYPDGLVVSGGKDTIIEVKAPTKQSSDNAERLLVGHANNVCALDVSSDGKYIVSGGWDGQGRVWNPSKWETEMTLGDHEGVSVWSVIAVDTKTVATGCADKSIRIFDLSRVSAGEAMPKFTIQTPDVVRALCRVPKNHPSGADIASASNDGIIRLWKLNGQQVAELAGHESFIYSLAALPSGEIASSGEDRTVRIWRGSDCVQTITHPAISVWTVAVNAETGDIVTGASDGVARIFTRRADNVADEQTLREFEDSVKGSAIPQQQVGGVNKEKLPGPEFLTTKSGTKDGQVQMIKEDNGNVTAHTWSVSQQQWVNVGTVVDAVGSTGKKVEYKGESYDYVFDVDIEDGKPPLKLPYNLSENPYDRATKFLGENELPLSYLDNVANFITQNTQGASLGSSEPSGGSDPYGTESRYRPGQDAQSQKAKLIPQAEFLSITAAKYEAIFNKIASVNKNMVSCGRKDAALNPTEEQTLQALQEALATSKPPPPQSTDLIVRVVTEWPYTDRLAGLDALRCMAKYRIVAQYSTAEYPSLIHLAIAASLPAEETPNENAVMMAARTIANIFATADGRSAASSHTDAALAFLERVTGAQGAEAIGKHNRNVLIALSTVALNFSVLVARENLLVPQQRRRLFVIFGTIIADQTDSEVLYRTLVGLGTLLMTSPELATGSDVKKWVQGASDRGSEDRVKQVAADVAKAIRS